MYALCGIRKFHIETTYISELKKIPEETGWCLSNTPDIT